ncbi:MAG: MBL fold metallo-hydrolase [Anaerolineae bacterium]
MSQLLTPLSEHLAVFHGAIQVGIMHQGGRALLFDYGEGDVCACLPDLGVTAVDAVLITHHHRDQCCGLMGTRPAALRGASVGAPAAERALFAEPASFWNDPAHRWHIYAQHPHHNTLAEPVLPDTCCADGDSWHWGPAQITACATPGHTDGSLSYVVEVDGLRVAFSGDLLYDAGRVWDLCALQKGEGDLTDYHGFLGARSELLDSLERLLRLHPSLLVPSHGRIMADPEGAVAALRANLEACYDQYVAISALRYYFPDLLAPYARPHHMPVGTTTPAPPCLRHISTSWVLLSETGNAFVMDCGASAVIDALHFMQRQGTLRTVEGLWVTHYHDDHVDAIPALQAAFDCPCITDASVAQVIREPMRWRLPCIAPGPVRVDRVAQEGESWTWHEFTLTAFHLPGQSLYHSGLLVEGQGLRMFFVGDSFTPGGIDDYCAQNRNWLGRGVGYDRCLELVERLAPAQLFNPHVDGAFTLTPDQCHAMRRNLAERESLWATLTPWEHPNYAMDETWVRCDPYEQRALAGQSIGFRVVITNHAGASRTVQARLVRPQAWGSDACPWGSVEIPAKGEEAVTLIMSIPEGAPAGRYVLPVDVVYGDQRLPQWAETVVVVPP